MLFCLFVSALVFAFNEFVIVFFHFRIDEVPNAAGRSPKIQTIFGVVGILKLLAG